MRVKTINWGIIGVGDVCEIKSGPAYQKTPGFFLKGVMRRDLDKAKDFATRHNVELFFNNAEELINRPDIDAIYIATPPDAHLEYALKVAKAGKICCVEKPMATTYNECEQMHEAFSRKDIPLFISYYRRSLPRFIKIKEWLDTNEIGKIRHINSTLCQPPTPKIDVSKNYNWRTDKNIALGGYFDDLASHGLDLFNFFLGEFDSVNGYCQNQQNVYSAYDSVTSSWQHKSGVTGSGFWNFGTYEKKDQIEILGSKGSIRFSVFEDNPVELLNEKNHISEYIGHPETIQLPHVENIKNHLDGTKQHPSMAKTALHTAWVMDKILGRI